MEFFKVETRQQAIDLIKIMPDVIAIDTEFVKGDPRTTKLLKVIIADDTRAWSIEPELLALLTPTIQSRSIILLQDYNHCDTVILLKHGCDLRKSTTFNLIDMHHLIDENADHDLGSRVLDNFSDNYKSKFWGKYKNYEDAPEDEALEYECKDAIYTYRLGVSDLLNVPCLYKNINKLRSALLFTELEGVRVDVELMTRTKETMKTKIEEYLPKLRSEFDDYCKIWEMRKWVEEINKRKTESGKNKVPQPVFSFASDKNVAWLVYEGLGLPIIEKTEKGNPSTSFETLKELSETHPEISTIVEYKEIKAVYSTFVEGMLERVDNGRIYPHFNVSGTATGRISHTNPNMGNLPKEGVIRNFFLPSEGMVLFGADYAQLEVVVELNLTEDLGLKEIVCGGASKHDLFKDALDKAGFNLPRSQVKNINFALQYGAGARKISKMVGCDETSANNIIKVFYDKFSGVKALKESVNNTLSKESKITNLAGRTRRFERSNNKYETYRQQRQAYNFLIQGVAAEACNMAYYRFHEWIKATGRGRAMFSVHDEIVAECLPENVEEYKKKLIDIMAESTVDFNFKYPLTAKAYGPLTCWSKT